MLSAYSIFDKKVGRYYRPTFAGSVVEVGRNLQILVKDQNSSLCLFPADFAVYDVGQFDDDKGLFIPEIPPKFVAEVMEYVDKERRVPVPSNIPPTMGREKFDAIADFKSRTGKKGGKK